MTSGALSRIGPTPIRSQPDALPAPDSVACVYQYALKHGGLDAPALDEVAHELGLSRREMFAATTRLVGLHMLRAVDAAGERLVPNDPQLAATLLVTPIEQAVCRQRELADRMRERITAIAEPGGNATPPPTIDSFTGIAEISGLLKLASDGCRDELVIMCPAGDGTDDVDRVFDGCLRACDDSVDVHIVYPHRTRAGLGARARAKRLTQSGAEIRTVTQVMQACAVFDRKLAVVLSIDADGKLISARRVTDDNVVDCLGDMFDQLWAGAAPFSAEDNGYAEEVTDDLQRRIAAMMAEGLTDEVVARRLGMSVRTCRRHIAALLRTLDSVSRFQAGVQAAQLLATLGV